jgi:Endonuclease domain
MFRIPISGWRKCLHEAAAFESRGEYAVATILDHSAAIDWWFRNDPARFRIPSPVGNFEPDFVYLAKRSNDEAYGLLEVKGEIFWDGEGSDPRIKSEAACRWVEAANAADAGGPAWEFALVLDTDAIDAGSLEGLRSVALVAAP